MKVIGRLPDKGYVDTWLWVPKSLINVTATQSALSFLFTDSYTGEQRVLSLWKESTHQPAGATSILGSWLTPMRSH